MDIVSLGTPFGLAFASGLNAYLPLLAFTVTARWLHLYKVAPNFAFVTSNWCIALLAILTLLDFVADKIPLLDHGWDSVHTIIRPITGAVVAAAAGNNALSAMHITPLASMHPAGRTIAALSTFPLAAIGPFVLLLIGGGLAALSHTAKATTRIVSTITTAGLLNIGLSVLEDILVIIFVLLSLFASAVMFVLLIVLILLIVPQIFRRRSWRDLFIKRGGIFP
jgi:hypothetical protein